MALYLNLTDTLFIHVPKTGGHWVKEVLKHCNISFNPAKPITNCCPAHGFVSDYAPASSTFCMTRDFDSWLKSWWCFHAANGNRQIDYQPGIQHNYRHLAPPMPDWHTWSVESRDDCLKYVADMQHGCDVVIDVADRVKGLGDFLRSRGYNVTDDQIAEVKPANVTNLKVELGGGKKAHEGSWTNVDMIADEGIRHDLNQYPWPFPDESVSRIYSSHCLEHLDGMETALDAALVEMARICKRGAELIIRVPHPHSDQAMRPGHRHTMSEHYLWDATRYFKGRTFTGDRRLELVRTNLRGSERLPVAKAELPFLAGLSDDTIMRWIPGTCFESEFMMRCVNNS